MLSPTTAVVSPVRQTPRADSAVESPRHPRRVVPEPGEEEDRGPDQHGEGDRSLDPTRPLRGAAGMGASWSFVIVSGASKKRKGRLFSRYFRRRAGFP